MGATQTEQVISEEDRLRADVYGFLAAQLFRRPDPETLDRMATLTGDDTPFGMAFRDLAKAAAATDPAEAGSEYDTLFIGLGRGELVPYASYYLTGFLNEKPLAALRGAMAELGIARSEAVKEPEDHIGSLMEIMAGLIAGRYAGSANAHVQAQFFSTHIAPWAGHFFKDLENASAARLYQPLGRIGRLFMEIEIAAFAME